MNTFTQSASNVAIRQLNKSTTTNGAAAYKSTLCANLDFFSRSGNINYPNALHDFKLALAEDEEIAIRNLLNTRDIREGKGIRQISKNLLLHLVNDHPKLVLQSNILQKFVELGRWDDIFVVAESGNNTILNVVVKFIATEMRKEQPDSLLFKWLPINSKKANERKLISKLRSYLHLTPKEFRKFVSSKRISFIPEYKFCTKQWSLLDYSSIPSQCFKKNKLSFQRNDSERFSAFIQAVIKGDDPKVKINANAIWPHEIIGSDIRFNWNGQLSYSDSITAAVEAQWKNLPNFMPEGLNILPIIDTSGSMTATAYSNYSCLHLSIALGIYLAERNKSAFKDLFMTFNTVPQFVSLSNHSTLLGKYAETAKAPWGGTTNIMSSFNLILKHAISNKVPQSDMPEYLLVLTDMNFNQNRDDPSLTIFESMKQSYRDAGYEAPTLVFWNLSSQRTDNTPVLFNDKGSVLVSGYSPSVLKAIFENTLDTYTPVNVMCQTLFKARYQLTFTN